MAERLGLLIAGVAGAFTVFFLMVFENLWYRAHGDKSMWDELWDRMKYLTGHMNNENS